MTPRRRIRQMALVAFAVLAACHDPDAEPIATPPVQVSEHVLEHLRRGGRVRPVIYTPPTDLSRPEASEMELPFPGPGTGEAEPPDTVGVDGPGADPPAG